MSFFEFLRCLWIAVVVFFRRLFRGPRLLGWSYRYELVLEIVREWSARGTGAPIERIRGGMLESRIHRKLRAHVVHERTTLAGLPTESFVPAGWKEGDPTLLYFHGGGYIVCSPATHRDLVSRIAQATGARTLAVEYRKAPEYPYPAPIDDCEAAYRELLEHGVQPSTLFVGGDSAGGGLTLAVLGRLRNHGGPMPRAGVLLSPWVDLEATGASVQKNAPYDYLRPEGLAWGASLYLAGTDARHPEVSAIHADLRGLPPLLVQSGGAELFLSENELLVERARAAGVEVIHDVEPGMVHVFQAFASFLPGCDAAISRIGAFVRDRHRAA